MGLLWGSYGALMGLSWGSRPLDFYGALVGLSSGSRGARGARGAPMGLPWGCQVASVGLPGGCHGACMRLLMGLPWGCYAAFMGPRCGLYGNADMLAVFWGSPPLPGPLRPSPKLTTLFGRPCDNAVPTLTKSKPSKGKKLLRFAKVRW